MKFYSQQIAATATILGAWLVVIFVSTRPTPPVQETTVVEQGPVKIVREARDEATGETMRTHHQDAYGQVTLTEITFKDGVCGAVHFDSLGRVKKVTETARDGSYQLFTFRHGRLAKRESFNKDGKLTQETAPVNKSLQTTFYAADGKTRTMVKRQMHDGSIEADLYWEDGKTLRAQLTAPPATQVQYSSEPEFVHLSGKLTAYSKDGKKIAEESFERSADGGECSNPGCHEYGSETAEVTLYRADGTMWIHQHRELQYGNLTLSGEEYGADGKTVVRELNPEGTANPSGSVLVEHGKSKVLRFLNYENKVEKEVTEGSDGTQNEVAVPKEKQVQLNLELLNYTPVKDELLPLMTAPDQPNRLRQMLSR